MAPTVTLEGIKKAVFFPVNGKGWGTKWLIGSALCLANFIVPIVPLIPLYGYACQIGKRVIQQDEDPELPEWKDWGLFFSDGIKLLGATLIYSLPGALIMLIGYLVMFAGNFLFMFDPSIYQSGSFSPTYFFSSMAGVFIGFILMLAGMLVSLLTSFLLQPALGHLIAKDSFNAAFQIKDWFPVLKKNFSGYLLQILLMYGINMALVWAVYILYFTIILCFLLPILMCVIMFLMNVLHLSLLSVAYRDGKNLIQQGEPG